MYGAVLTTFDRRQLRDMHIQQALDRIGEELSHLCSLFHRVELKGKNGNDLSGSAASAFASIATQCEELRTALRPIKF